MICHTNTFQTCASLNLSVWVLSTTACRGWLYSPSLSPVPSAVCLKWFGSVVGQAQSAGVRAAGEHTTHLCHFLTLPAVFHASDVQSAWRVTAPCHVSHGQPLKPQGGHLLHGMLLWNHEVTWTLYVGHMVPVCLLPSFSSTRSHEGLHRWGRARVWPYFSAATEWAHGSCDNKLLVRRIFLTCAHLIMWVVLYWVI